MSREQEVLDALKAVIDPDLGRDIVSLGFIKNLAVSDTGDVTFNVELTTPACPVRDRFKSECERLVLALPWTRQVSATVTAQRPKNPLQAQAPGLRDVRNILAVSSCKGGVGKSTVAVNLAYTLARSGARVGLFDADVYGPSLPTVVRLDQTEVYQKDGLILPLEFEGVKLMSFGYVSPKGESQAAIMRGPMVSQVINQLLTGTDWGELDYLLLDLPPGTGDIPLTLSQIIPITAAAIVTTPQHLSFIDVVKGLHMFQKLNVPTVAVVENMSWFQPEPDGPVYHPFGQGAREKLIERYGFRNTFELPIEPALSASCDEGRPFVLAKPENAAASRFQEIADTVVREISILRHGENLKPTVSYTPEQGVILKLPDGRECAINPVDLRYHCRGAHTIDEATGERKIERKDIPPDIYPESISPMGNYAVSIVWSHGHPPSIYPYEQLLEIAGLEPEPVRT